ncbi:hypothetical protein LAJ19_01895 [Deinococcus taeanensis]|uniref:hypothetical protein n=1 Tax=Deinococcus taeanensis TaxID=2737050 RepID=UPI001CDBAC7B|nr:hypothetical protein [Deinococcus taeanensis]UBV43002.1 hypothetical protein LAJ19_01895 [Deinococcus taeanensis]
MSISRPLTLLTLCTLLCAPAHAWVPQLEDTTARNVIDGVYGRRDPVPTYLTVDLSVKDGTFAAGKDAVTAFDGGAACVADWLAAPTNYARGSRPASLTVSGQADQLYFQAQDARDSFRNLSVKDALSDGYASKRLPAGQLRVDLAVRGLPSEKARGAYLVRLRGPDGKLIAPVKSTYVNDWKPLAPVSGAAGAATGTAPVPAQAGAASAPGPVQGTLVYYFEPLKAGLGASDTLSLLVRTEADSDCAYAVPLDLSTFN